MYSGYPPTYALKKLVLTYTCEAICDIVLLLMSLGLMHRTVTYLNVGDTVVSPMVMKPLMVNVVPAWFPLTYPKECGYTLMLFEKFSRSRVVGPEGVPLPPLVARCAPPKSHLAYRVQSDVMTEWLS